MTVSTQTAKSQATGNGVTTAFTGSFPILDETHVTVITTTSGVDSTKVLNTDYTISGVGGSTFTVTFGTAPASGVRVTIARSVPLTQELDLTPNAALPSDQLEESYDKAVMIDQQVNDAVTRSLRFPVSDSSARVSELPTSTLRAGKVLAFDADGDVIVSTEDLSDIEDSITESAASAAAAAASASAAQTAETNAETAEAAAEAAQAAAEAAAASVPSFPIDPADTTFAATARVLGRKTAGAGTGEEVSLSELLDFIGSAAQGDILYRDAAAWARLAAGTSGQFLQTQGAGSNPAWAAATSTPQILHVRDEKAANTAGGDFNSGAWRTRTLNTVATNTISGASLGSNQITLPAGTYDVRARGPINGVKQTKSRIYNISDSADAIIGATGYSHSANDTFDDVLVWGRITIASSKTFELQQWCNTTVSTNGFGLPANIDSKVEVYAEVWIEKVA
jgi:hypothetical protein